MAGWLLSSYCSVKGRTDHASQHQESGSRSARPRAHATDGESITEAVIRAMQERLERERSARGYSVRLQELRRIRERYQSLPLQDARSAEEILGYDETGLPR
ncbi:MAG: type II toxin-antitoxin system VapB family antitoxin [Longimicrobiales bacterium]